MLSGVNNYYALDVVKYSNTDFNLQILEELVELFKKRAGRPKKGWPDYDPYLDNNLFPSHILTEKILSASLHDARIAMIRETLLNPNSSNNGMTIKYCVPWSDRSIIENETIDVIISHSVMEHVNDIEDTYKALYMWLKYGGFMSHQTHFDSHNMSIKWNGHWGCSELVWKILAGKRPFAINREPYSAHIDIIRKNSFKIICNLKRYRTDGIKRSQLSSRWRYISDDNLKCYGAFIQAEKH
ncbi:hypothetical protein QUF90_23955 [Desulfococcaceae bacterium HSG9]|nr:hypothetical protein [Desulfococcaceae bacterium HSG9]